MIDCTSITNKRDLMFSSEAKQDFMVKRIIGAVLMLIASGILVWFVFLSPDKSPTSSIAKATMVPYEVPNWNQLDETPLNISLYTFRDRNRNGEYDIEDLPMASVIVELTQADQDQDTHLVGSNINGYANFKMHNGNPEHPISKAEMDYLFRVRPPPKWKVTSGNIEQRIHFKKLAGSVAGLVAEKPPHWVGLAPELSITLSVISDNGMAKSKDFSLRAISPSGESLLFTPDPDGLIIIPAYPGTWRIIVQQTETNWNYEQIIDVKNTPVVFMPIILGRERIPALTRQVV